MRHVGGSSGASLRRSFSRLLCCSNRRFNTFLASALLGALATFFDASLINLFAFLRLLVEMLFRLLEQRLAEGAIVSVHVGIVPCLLELVNLGPAHTNVLSDLHGEILLILCSFLVGLVLIKSLCHE